MIASTCTVYVVYSVCMQDFASLDDVLDNVSLATKLVD